MVSHLKFTSHIISKVFDCCYHILIIHSQFLCQFALYCHHMLIGHLKTLSMSVCLWKLTGRLVLHCSCFPNVLYWACLGKYV